VDLADWMLDPSVVHLNHGSFGAVLKSTFAVAEAARRRMEAAPMRYFVLDWQDEIDRARAALAAFVKAPADKLVFVPSATTGVAIALRSVVLEPGDEVLMTSHSYRAVSHQIRRLWRNITVVHVDLPYDEDELVSLLGVTTTGNTKVAVLDHITSPTALRFPLERVVPMLRDRGITVIVDGAHAPGQIDLDVGALLEAGVTYYAGNNHKWLCAPKSSGFLVAAGPVKPIVTSHGAAREYGPENRLHAELDWSGTHDPSAHLAVPAAIAAFDWPRVIERNHALAIEMRRRLTDALGARTLAPESALGCMAAIPITVADPRGFEKQLLRDGWEVPIVEWIDGPLVRVSAHLYNTADQADALARELLARGVRGR
jgi:isopenicillin-N epimerase